MSALILRALEHVHGHLGVLSAAALIHPAVLLRRRGRGVRAAAAAATLLATTTGVLGATIYPHYRATLKPVLLTRWPTVGWAFERKEHLGVAAIIFSWVGLAALLADSRRPRAIPASVDRTAHLAYVFAAAAATATALLGIWVASYLTF